MNARTVTNVYENFSKELKILSASQLLEIEAMSQAMTKSECLAFFLLVESQLSKRENEIVDLSILRGRAKGIRRASEKLFTNMSDSKQGTQACLSYLKRFSTEFAKEVDDSEGSSGFSYNITINAEKETKEQSERESPKKKADLIPIK